MYSNTDDGEETKNPEIQKKRKKEKNETYVALTFFIPEVWYICKIQYNKLK